MVEVVEQSYERSGGLKNSSPSDSTQDADDDLYNFLSLDMSLQDLTLYFALNKVLRCVSVKRQQWFVVHFVL
jgi:hypothetical protein